MECVLLLFFLYVMHAHLDMRSNELIKEDEKKRARKKRKRINIWLVVPLFMWSQMIVTDTSAVSTLPRSHSFQTQCPVSSYEIVAVTGGHYLRKHTLAHARTPPQSNRERKKRRKFILCQINNNC